MTRVGHFEPKEITVYTVLDKIAENWHRDYSSLLINIDVDKDLQHFLSEDVLTVIFDNLILNTAQQNDKQQNIRIEIHAKK